MKNYWLILVLIIFSCKKKEQLSPVSIEKIKDTLTKPIEKKSTKKKEEDSIWSNDSKFINDSILKGKFKLNISKYVKNSLPYKISKKDIKEFYNEEIVNLGDLNNDKKDDFGFRLYNMESFYGPQSYYFSDNKIPIIETESECCHSTNLFSIGDIDEDGGNEIGQFTSSCAGSSKWIIIWTLKKNKWREVGVFGFNVLGEYSFPEDTHKLHKKIAKGKFKFLDVYGIDVEGKTLKDWKTVVMKKYY